MAEKAELKPCPFCGGKAVLKNAQEDYWVACYGEDCEVCPETECYDTAKKAIAAWNKRAD